MNKKYSIGFLIGAVIMIVLFVIAYNIHLNRIENAPDEVQMKEATQNEVESCYYIKELDGYVVVYEADQKTVYEYTSILVENLPLETQERIREGMKVTSLGQMYGFLENYSS